MKRIPDPWQVPEVKHYRCKGQIIYKVTNLSFLYRSWVIFCPLAGPGGGNITAVNGILRPVSGVCLWERERESARARINQLQLLATSSVPGNITAVNGILRPVSGVCVWERERESESERERERERARECVCAHIIIHNFLYVYLYVRICIHIFILIRVHIFILLHI